MDQPPMTGARALQEMPAAESLRLLGSAAMGRLVFTARALPAIRPVNHLIDDGRIIIRTAHSASIAAMLRCEGASVVAFQADDIDPASHLGWSVTVIGLAAMVTDPDEAERFRMRLQPWVTGARDVVIAVKPELVTGIRLAVGHAAGPDEPATGGGT